MSSAPVPSSTAANQPQEFRLFSTSPRQGKWSGLISALLNNEQPRAALGGDLEVLKDLLRDARTTLDAETVVLNLTVAQDERMVLVGDIHGQLRDLQTHILDPQRVAMQQANEGEKKRKDDRFLFLGDYVDRGPHGVEVIMLLLALKVEYPDNIFLIRGNHEDVQTCRLYGFLQECKSKLDFSCFSCFTETFCHLPLAATVTCTAGSIFCAHGGLSPHTVAIEALMFIQRIDYGESMDSNEESEIVDGLLWSDPCDRAGFKQNMRGCGFTFGPDATESFCSQNDVQFICRAHQMVMEGFLWDHNEKLLTIFSAPNYCGINNNKGAIAILDGGKQEKNTRIKLEIVQYDSAPASPCLLYGRSPTVEGTSVEEFFASPPSGALEAPPMNKTSSPLLPE
jgi:diadenosine tetraphosphatase ApaH/serine/threonine PP2A family protein phosphatase